MFRFLIPFASVALIAAACATAPKTEADKDALSADAAAAISNFKRKDPSLEETFFEKSAGYAVLPSITKAGAGVGGAYGKGLVFEQGGMLGLMGDKLVGYCDMTQASFGFQLGGQAFSQIIFFETEAALKDFTSGSFEFSAQVSAVAAEAGASASTNYVGGMAVFTMTKAGLMYEATVSGQKFAFVEP